jgi:hypothetical protein
VIPRHVSIVEFVSAVLSAAIVLDTFSVLSLSNDMSACFPITFHVNMIVTVSLSKMAAKMADNGKSEHERVVKQASK